MRTGEGSLLVFGAEPARTKPDIPTADAFYVRPLDTQPRSVAGLGAEAPADALPTAAARLLHGKRYLRDRTGTSRRAGSRALLT
jgi:hypothetical protein